MKKATVLASTALVLMTFLLSSCATEVSQEEYNRVSGELAIAQARIQSLELSEAQLKRQLSEAKQNSEEVNSQLLATKSERDKLNAEVATLREQLAMTSTSSPPSVPTSSSKLKRGLQLIAQDGTYLGTLDSGLASKSIFNDLGKYGSELSSTSIWNELSKYGSQLSSLSAFSDLASKPPMLYDGDIFICYVTTNTLKSPRVSPYSLIAFAESMGWK